MGELQSALDSLAAEDLKPMFGPQLLDRLGELLQAKNRIDAELARTMRECELTQAAEHDGLKSMPSWLRGHGRLSQGAAARIVHAGRALEHLPAVAAGFAAGEVTAEQVAVVAKAVRPDRLAAAAAQDIDLAGFDATWARLAAEAPHDRLVEAVQLYEDALDPDGPEPDPTDGRRLTLARHAEGGSGRFDLDTVGFEKLQAAIESIVQAARPAGDTRTRSQQQADALVQLADNALAAGTLPFLRTAEPHVIVTIDHEDLADTTTTGPGAAQTGFGARISAAKARWLACDATISRMVMGPDGLPLDVGRDKRVVPPHIRRAVERRDGHCVFAGCSAPTHWCDVHHVAEWLRDGGGHHWRTPRSLGSIRPPPGARGELASRGEGVVLLLPPRRHRDHHRTEVLTSSGHAGVPGDSPLASSHGRNGPSSSVRASGTGRPSSTPDDRDPR